MIVAKKGYYVLESVGEFREGSSYDTHNLRIRDVEYDEVVGVINEHGELEASEGYEYLAGVLSLIKIGSLIKTSTDPYKHKPSFVLPRKPNDGASYDDYEPYGPADIDDEDCF